MANLNAGTSTFIDFIPTLAASTYGNAYQDEAAWAVLITTTLFSLLFGIGIYVVYCIFLMKLYAKANVPAWKAWVPFVNTWKFFELGGYKGALSLLLLAGLIPCVGWIGSIIGYVLYCIAAYQIGLKNGKEGYWVVLFIFFGIVWMGILGLGRSIWNDSLGKPSYGPERPPSWPPYADNNHSGWSTPPNNPVYPPRQNT